MPSRPTTFGKYQLIERIAVGGMAEVYKARLPGAEGFEKIVAIKRILPEVAEDDDFVKMFIDEAKIVVQLGHPNIAQIYDLGREGDAWFIALEYVSGRDLRALLERLRRREEALPPDLAAFILARVAEGLDHAHRRRDAAGRELQIVHRDISPQNVLVSFDGDVKLIDFGIAKAASKALKTQAGILKGKFGYMSPEQVRGKGVDRRSDVFAMGTVLFELLTGERLFTGASDYSVLEKVRKARIPMPVLARRNVPIELEAVLLRALERDPADRFAWASELGAELQHYLLSRERPVTREDLGAYLRTLFPEEYEHEQRGLAGRAKDGDSSPRIISRRNASRSGAGKGALRAGVLSDDSVRLRVKPKVVIGSVPPAESEALRDEDRTVVQARFGEDDGHDPGEDTVIRPAPAATSPRSSLPLPVGVSESLPPPPKRRPPPVPFDDELALNRSVEDQPTRVHYAPVRPAEATRVSHAPARESTLVFDARALARSRLRSGAMRLTAAALILVFLGASVWNAREIVDRLQPLLGLRPAVGLAQLTVATDPPDADVLVDGAPLPRGPDGSAAGGVPADRPVVVTVRREGFRETAQPVNVPAGATRELKVSLHALRPAVTLRTSPPGAVLFIDGERVGRSPESLRRLDPGRYLVRAKLDCHTLGERLIEVGESDMTVDLTLEPLPGACLAMARASTASGVLVITSRPPGARILVNDQDTRRVTPAHNLRLPAGTHRVRLVAGSSTEEFEVEIRPRKTSQLQIELH